MTCLCRHQFCYVCGADWLPAHYQNHDENGVFIPPQNAPEIVLLPHEYYNNPAPEIREERGCTSNKTCFALTLPLRIIAAIVLYCLVIALFGIVATLATLACLGTGRSKGQRQTSSDREMNNKICTCISDMCSAYFKLYIKVW
jgi:hypothetical protein